MATGLYTSWNIYMASHISTAARFAHRAIWSSFLLHVLASPHIKLMKHLSKEVSNLPPELWGRLHPVPHFLVKLDCFHSTFAHNGTQCTTDTQQQRTNTTRNTHHIALHINFHWIYVFNVHFRAASHIQTQTSDTHVPASMFKIKKMSISFLSRFAITL